APQGERVARFLDHADREVRRQALKSLGGMRLRSMVPAVSRRLDDPDEGIRRTAVHALLRMEGVKEASVLHGLLNAERWTRGWAFHALGSLGVVLDGPLLVSQLSRPEAEARAAAAEALGRLRADRYANQVAALLSDTDPWVRNRAAFALGRMEAVKQAEALLPLLEERVQGHLIFAAALAIAEMADKIPEDARRRIIPALEELEKRKSISPYEPAVAGVALSRLGAKDRAAERGVLALLREQFASGGSNWPEFSIAMIDSLSRRFEKEAWERFTRPLTLRRPIENIADYVALMKEAGFGLQASEGLFFDGELYEGSRTTPADALELLTGSDSNASTWDRSWVVLEGNQARLVRIPVALRAWEKRLEEK
ncbi:MAG: HEAT repeat domain-containing protein, partial [Planctomycetes bacterium]|nr:HEAT repeat domain-containing protein [Planctomycetota bacterium]